eukprot:tig00000939_g5485.t1
MERPPDAAAAAGEIDVSSAYDEHRLVATSLYVAFASGSLARSPSWLKQAAQHARAASEFALRTVQPSSAVGWARVAVDFARAASAAPSFAARCWVTLARALDAVGRIELALQAAKRAQLIASATRDPGVADPELRARLQREVETRSNPDIGKAALAVESQNSALQLAAERQLEKAEEQAHRAIRHWQLAGLGASKESAKAHWALGVAKFTKQVWHFYANANCYEALDAVERALELDPANSCLAVQVAYVKRTMLYTEGMSEQRDARRFLESRQYAQAEMCARAALESWERLRRAAPAFAQSKEQGAAVEGRRLLDQILRARALAVARGPDASPASAAGTPRTAL